MVVSIPGNGEGVVAAGFGVGDAVGKSPETQYKALTMYPSR